MDVILRAAGLRAIASCKFSHVSPSAEFVAIEDELHTDEARGGQGLGVAACFSPLITVALHCAAKCLPVTARS